MTLEASMIGELSPPKAANLIPHGIPEIASGHVPEYGSGTARRAVVSM